MPTLKDLLKVPLALPKTIEASLPKGVPQVSNVLASITDSLPEIPALPNGLTLPTGANQLPKIPVVTEFIKSIETGLPVGLPKLGQSIPGAEEVAPAPAKAPTLVFE